MLGSICFEDQNGMIDNDDDDVNAIYHDGCTDRAASVIHSLQEAITVMGNAGSRM